jgi:hypothetical protein
MISEVNVVNNQDVLIIVDRGMVNGNTVSDISIDNRKSVVIRGVNSILNNTQNWRCGNFGESLKFIAISNVGCLWIAAEMPSLEELHITDVDRFIIGDEALVRAYNLRVLKMKNVGVYIFNKRPVINTNYQDLSPSQFSEIQKIGLFIRSDSIAFISLDDIKFYYLYYCKVGDYNDNAVLSFNNYQLMNGNLAVESNGSNTLKIEIENCSSIEKICAVNIGSLEIAGFNKKIAYFQDIMSLSMQNGLELSKLKVVNVGKIVNFPIVKNVMGNRCIGIENYRNYLNFHAMFDFLKSFNNGMTKKVFGTLVDRINSEIKNGINAVVRCLFDYLVTIGVNINDEMQLLSMMIDGKIYTKIHVSCSSVENFDAPLGVGPDEFYRILQEIPYLNKLKFLNIISNFYVVTSDLVHVISPAMKQVVFGCVLNFNALHGINAPDLELKIYASSSTFDNRILERIRVSRLELILLSASDGSFTSLVKSSNRVFIYASDYMYLAKKELGHLYNPISIYFNIPVVFRSLDKCSMYYDNLLGDLHRK